MLNSFKKSKIGNNQSHQASVDMMNLRSLSQTNQPAEMQQTSTLKLQGNILPQINRIGAQSRESRDKMTDSRNRNRQRSLTNNINIQHLSMTQLHPIGALKTNSYASLLQNQGDSIKASDLILKDPSQQSQVLLSKILVKDKKPRLIGEDQLKLPN